jgi:hypothetical protein
MTEHVTAGEFARWMNHLSKQNEAILFEQRKTNGRVTALETEQKVVKRVVALVSAGISLFIAALGLILQYVGK